MCFRFFGASTTISPPSFAMIPAINPIVQLGKTLGRKYLYIFFALSILLRILLLRWFDEISAMIFLYELVFFTDDTYMVQPFQLFLKYVYCPPLQGLLMYCFSSPPFRGKKTTNQSRQSYFEVRKVFKTSGNSKRTVRIVIQISNKNYKKYMCNCCSLKLYST